jgi:hypothetical protein
MSRLSLLSALLAIAAPLVAQDAPPPRGTGTTERRSRSDSTKTLSDSHGIVSWS